ncbi:MAG: hypothetical protein SOW44_00380 [Porphyromonas sp.]|nr:hypothetical protein [Bacteroidales bacterium]MDD7558711.1 hypothetical protein [Bacteroidales bacterium]MDY3099790.1 hypothetical protein [Porphyromonas sp.]
MVCNRGGTSSAVPSHTWKNHFVTVESLEEEPGLTLFPNLPMPQTKEIKRQKDEVLRW